MRIFPDILKLSTIDRKLSNKERHSLNIFSLSKITLVFLFCFIIFYQIFILFQFKLSVSWNLSVFASIGSVA